MIYEETTARPLNSSTMYFTLSQQPTEYLAFLSFVGYYSICGMWTADGTNIAIKDDSGSGGGIRGTISISGTQISTPNLWCPNGSTSTAYVIYK